MPAVLLVACIVAFGLLALATSRQQEVVCRRKLGAGTARAIRSGGWILMALALVACVATRGWALGLVAFSGYTSLGAALVYVALIVRQRLRG